MRTVLGGVAALGTLFSISAGAETASFRILPLQAAPDRWSLLTHVSDDGSVVAGYLQRDACAGRPCGSYVGQHAFLQRGLAPIEIVPPLSGTHTNPQNFPTAMSGSG